LRKTYRGWTFSSTIFFWFLATVVVPLPFDDGVLGGFREDRIFPPSTLGEFGRAVGRETVPRAI